MRPRCLSLVSAKPSEALSSLRRNAPSSSDNLVQLSSYRFAALLFEIRPVTKNRIAQIPKCPIDGTTQFIGCQSKGCGGPPINVTSRNEANLRAPSLFPHISAARGDNIETNFDGTSEARDVAWSANLSV
jgi:hypothetical protein